MSTQSIAPPFPSLPSRGQVTPPQQNPSLVGFGDVSGCWGGSSLLNQTAYTSDDHLPRDVAHDADLGECICVDFIRLGHP